MNDRGPSTLQKRRMWIAGAAALGLATLVVAPPHAALEIHAHRPDDLAPQRVQAAVDLGGIAISILVTWSRDFAK
ncbi:hypothetical protein ACX40Y_11875 [Sphingomonas sp. RS6]